LDVFTFIEGYMNGPCMLTRELKSCSSPQTWLLLAILLWTVICHRQRKRRQSVIPF